MVRTTTIGLMSLAILAVSGPLQADTINTHFSGVGIGEGVRIHHSSQSGGSSSTTAGRFDWTVNATTTYGGRVFNIGDQYSTFCTEIVESVTPGGNYVYTNTAIADMPSPGGGMGTFRAGLLQELFNNHFTQAVTGTSTLDLREAAAFQVAVWEIVYETDARIDESSSAEDLHLGLAAGYDGSTANGFYISTNGAVASLANTWLNELLGGQAVTNLLGFSNNGESTGSQDQVGVMVPLPAPIWLAGMGLLGVVFGRKRLRRLATG